MARNNQDRLSPLRPDNRVPLVLRPGLEEESPGALLIVDSSSARRRSIVRALEELGHHIIEASSTSEALCAVAQCQVGVVLIDLFTPGLGAIGFCQTLGVSSKGSLLPVMVLSPQEDVESEVLAMEAGADGFIVAPVRPRLLRAAVQARLKRKLLFHKLDETETVLLTLAQSIEGRDPALGDHCERLAHMATAMGICIGLPTEDILTLQRGGYLHDIGKVGLPDKVLLKPGPLTPEEWETMKTHAARGEKICSGVQSLAPVLPIIRHHHEKWDGSGYPDGLRGDEIPLLARILQIADIYDALTAVRPYKRAFTPDEALETVKLEARKGWRDPSLIKVLEDLMPFFKSGPASDTAPTSLAALAVSVGDGKKGPGRDTSKPSPTRESEIKLVSGL